MSIHRITNLGDEEVRVEELMTIASAGAVIADLHEDGLHHEALVWNKEVRDAIASGKHTFWSVVMVCRQCALPDALWSAWHEQSRSGSRLTLRKSAHVLTCIY